MAASRDEMTRATRLAANVAAAAVVGFAALWFLTTQVRAIRDLSPFADDPWDAFATYAAIFLPVVAGATWVRSLRHRTSVLPTATARRIRWGSGLAAGIVLVAAAADLQAILTFGWPADAGNSAAVSTALVVASMLTAVAALGLTVRASRVARAAAAEPTLRARNTEPDLVDDLLELAAEVATPLGLRRPVERLAGAIERFLDASPVSPRRHRILFGVALALGAAVAFDLWHLVLEGPWISLLVAVVFGALTATGVLAIYLGTVGPLRLLRPASSDYADAPE